MTFKCLKFNRKRTEIPAADGEASRLGNSRKLKHINITELNNGESAKVIELFDNNEIMSKLEAMGIIPGAVVTKKSAIPAKGPIIIEKELVQFAVGYDMAQKIIVEPVQIENGNGL